LTVSNISILIYPKLSNFSYDLPIAEHGWLEIELADDNPIRKRIGITRLHMEEAGKLVHAGSDRLPVPPTHW